MTKEDLLKLRSNAINHENKTGFPHIDRSYFQFYSEKDLENYNFPDMSMYELLYRRIKENKFDNLIAMEYFGRKITYDEFLKKIDSYAATFVNLGVKTGEVVSIACPNIPEVFYSIYALNKIGAIANLIDPRNNLDRIKQYINQTNSKKLIMLDIVYPKIMKIFSDTTLKEVYTVSAADSLPLGLNYIQSAKTLVENHRKGLPICPKNDIYRPLNKLVSLNKDFNIGEYKNDTIADNVAIIINTSGTTGTPKGVMLTNENLNAIAYNYINTPVNYEVGDTFLGIMPNFLAYGVGLGAHVFFALGTKNVLIPTFTPDEFPKLLLKYRPAHFAGVPDYYQHIMEDPKMQNADLSFIKNPCAGGNSFDPNIKKKCNDFLEAHNCRYKIMVGWGLTENAGMSTAQYYIGESNEQNELNTVGIPALYNNVYVQSRETGEFLKTNEVGELILSGKSVMKGYVNNPEETRKVIEEKDGIRYLHTGDIGYVDDDGLVYVIDRIKRIIIRPDGHNVFPAYIENVVTKHPFVKDCVCVGLKENEDSNGKIPVAFITILEGHESEVAQIIEDLKAMSLRDLPERDVALDYIVLDKIPMTDVGKQDFKKLESYPYDRGNSRKRI